MSKKQFKAESKRLLDLDVYKRQDYALAQIQQAALEARLASGGGEDTPAYAARGAYLLRHDQPAAGRAGALQGLRDTLHDRGS